MVQSVRKDIPTGSLVLLAKPNSAGESCVYLRYYLGKYVKRSTWLSIMSAFCRISWQIVVLSQIIFYFCAVTIDG